jgi:hypothetical protein
MAAQGLVYCWGSNVYGAVSDPPGETVLVPRVVAGLRDVRSVALSLEHSCALTNAGEVYCWGGNDRGQIGGASAPPMTCRNAASGSRADRPCQPTPTRVDGIANAVQVAVSSGRSCALLGDYTVRCWGDVGGLGDWSASLGDVRSIALGAMGACAVTSERELRCSGEELERAIHTLDVPNLVAVELSGDTANADGAFACSLDANGGVLCVGDTNFGQLGIGDPVSGSVGTRAVENAKDIALGAAHACAFGSDGAVRCWGKNSNGQVGPAPLVSPSCGSEPCETTPQIVPGLPAVAGIATGGNLSCALAHDSTLWCWGADPFSLGAPLRVGGPWEMGGEECNALVSEITTSLYERVASDHSCGTDSDCVELRLDLSCSATCAAAALPRASADAVAARLADLEKDACPQARALGCVTPDLVCPASNTEAVCNAGYCTREAVSP